ncbi:MAG: ABC transporter permease [Actinomycetota bacterium]
MWALIVKEFRQLRRDHRTVAMMIVMPLLLLIVFGYAASFDVRKVSAIVVGPEAERASGRLPGLFEVTDVRPGEGRAEAEAALREGEAVVALVTGGEPEVLVDGTELFSARAVVTALRGADAPNAPPVDVLFNPDLETSAVMVPAIAGMILVFIGTLITSLGVVRERQAGTLEQLAVMPFRPRDVFVGKIAPYFVVAAVDLAIVVTAGILLFDVPFEGSVATFALGAVLFLFVTLGLGVLISSVSENQGQAIQLALMSLLPQVLLSGMIFPIESMAAGIRWIAYLLPLTYFIDIARGVMVRGAPIDSLVFPLGMLGVLGTAVFGLAVLRFRRDLAPARKHHRTPAPRPVRAGETR